MRKTLFFLATIAVIFGMIFSNTIPTQAQNSIAWTGAWQMGPSMDAAALWGGSVGDGAARFSGTYYNGFVYFLGVRDSNDSTYGAVFKFDVNTQTFSATGVSMPTPVSNYLISVIENDGRGHGAGLYILGGRKNDATLNNLIQVYYPLDNSVTSITTDPVPGIARNIGGQVAVNGKIYIFGGFNSTTMYAESYDYDPAAAVGSRWTNLGCNLPTPRSYISAAAIGNLIYAMGGDEYNGTNLVPIAQTLVFDTTNPSACWVDAGMPDLPIADGDAPAVYVSHADNAYLGGASGAIFVIGGYWPSPGPYRWVFRYDVAGNTWEQFPQLAIPAPATGRRNQAAIYIPSQALNGLGAGVPGIWTFGGVDNYANAMTATSEFFSITNCTAVLLPEQLEADTVPGGSALHHFSLLNQSGSSHVFNLSFTSDQPTWVTTMPVTLSVDNNTTSTFNMSVAVPASVSCPATGNFTVTATAQGAPSVTDSQAVTVKAVCGLAGTITDANTGLALQGAYVWMQTDPNGLTGDYYDAYTDANGQYLMINVNPGTYLLGADHQYYQPSFLPAGWPDGAVSVTIIADTTGPVSVALKASTVQWSPTDKLTATVIAGETGGADLILDNTAGTAPLHFSTSIVDSSQAVPPPAMSEGVPGLPRLDPQIESDMANSPDGAADFVVVLTHKADLSQAYNIQDWYERGQYVYNTLTQFANRTQTGLRRYLDAQGASYTPLYIINGVIVRGGNSTLTNTLLARPDVLQLVGNHAIAMDAPTFNVLYQPYAVQQPESIGWNITNTNAPQVWSTYGDKGAGITVAEIDTGTQWDHPALKAHYRGWDNGTGTVDHNYNWFDPYNQSPLVPRDTSAHGTHVMGTMVGDDGNPGTHQIGMAPGAKWITCKGGDEVSGYLLTHELLVCAQWIVAPTDLAVANPDPAKRPDVVNNSWGGGPNDYWYTDAVSAWKAAGIFSQFANGNSGPFCSTAHSPGDYWNTFAAGATSSTNAIASFSSRGPAVGTNILKPDIAAPGVNIWSSVPSNAYAAYDGTSMASPHVAGAVALLWSAVPELKGQIDLTNWILEQTATPLLTTQGCGGDTPTSHPNNVFGWGLLNIKAAVDLAKQTPAHTPGWVSVYPSAGGTVPAGSSVTLRVKFTPPSATPVGLKTFTLWLVSDDPYNHDVSLPIEVTIISELKLYLPGVMKTP